MISRRQVLKGGAAATAGLVVFPRVGWSRGLAAAAQTPLPGKSIAQFADPLPALDVIRAGADTIELQMREFQAQVLPTGSPRRGCGGSCSLARRAGLPTSGR